MRRRLYLYTTEGCHLCEQAERLMAPVLHERGIELEKIEISESDELVARYGIRIPVISLGDPQSDLGWPFSEAEFLELLDRLDS